VTDSNNQDNQATATATVYSRIGKQHAVLVTTLYLDLLKRDAVSSDLQFWGGELAAGVPLGRVVRDIGFSREHRALSGCVTAAELRLALRDARRSLRPIQKYLEQGFALPVEGRGTVR
jgi:hypothetical protein